MPHPSLTSSDSFRLRIQRSEQARALLMAGVYAVMLLITSLRRLIGGTVMAQDLLFWSMISAFALGLAAGLLHILLVLNIYRHGNAELGHLPILFTYSLTLFIIAFAGKLVTEAARRYVVESMEEAAAHLRAEQALAGVERDLEVARGIQSGLLPSGPPNFPGFDFAGMNIPAEKTGGDYFDWQPLPNSRLLIAMADVTGHGIGPALVMAICRAYSRAVAPLESSLSALLNRLNTLLCSDLRGTRFITLAVALLDPRGRIELLSAGHGPSMLYRAATTSVEQFGVERVAETITRSAHKSSAEVMKDLHASVLAFVGGAPQKDDLTIVVVRRSA